MERSLMSRSRVSRRPRLSLPGARSSTGRRAGLNSAVLAKAHRDDHHVRDGPTNHADLPQGGGHDGEVLGRHRAHNDAAERQRADRRVHILPLIRLGRKWRRALPRTWREKGRSAQVQRSNGQVDCRSIDPRSTVCIRRLPRTTVSLGLRNDAVPSAIQPREHISKALRTGRLLLRDATPASQAETLEV